MFIIQFIIGPRREKTCLLGLRLVDHAQTSLGSSLITFYFIFQFLLFTEINNGQPIPMMMIHYMFAFKMLMISCEKMVRLI